MGKKNKRHHKSETSQEEDKPLKLVLKVGTPDTQDVAPTEPVEDVERKHKHKKKKKKHSGEKHKHHHEHHSDRKEKRKRESDVASGETGKNSTELGESPSKKRVVVEEPVTRVVKTEVKSESSRVRLHAALCYLQKTLQRKDSNGFFVYPVTDSIAPGYSDIIEQPMDFSTMKKKVDNNEYTCIADYRRDFKLMCDNCMTYNHPDTIFYKEARRLLSSGLKITTKEKLKHHTMPALINLMPEDFGPEEFSLADIEQLDEDNANAKTSIAQSGTTMSCGSGGEVAGDAVKDDTSPEELLAEVEEAANEAADNLADKNPLGKMGYLQRLENGATVLNFLNPDNDGIVEEQKRVITLGALTGKLQSGTGSIAGFKEDKRNRATPVHYLTYGPFSSYGPIYDSSAANLSKEDSDLLLSTYGDETGVQYAKSLRNFVADADNYAIKMVDNLLDVLTHNEHSKTLKHFQSSQQQTEQAATTEKTPSKSAIDFDSLRSLSSLGIDMSFLDTFEKSAKTDSIQNQLDTTSRLLSALQTAQQERLGENTPQHLAFVSGPSEKEIKIANEVKKGIAVLTKQVAPGSIVDVSTLKGCVQESAGDAPNTTTTAETATTTTTTTATTTSATVVVIDDIETEVTKAAVTVT